MYKTIQCYGLKEHKYDIPEVFGIENKEIKSTKFLSLIIWIAGLFFIV